MTNPIITGQVTQLSKVYTGTLTVETYDTITDPPAYLAVQLTGIKIALGITEAAGVLGNVVQVSMTTRGDVRRYVFTLTVTV